MDISDGTLFEDVCRYSCDAGYMLVGPANRTCQADGQWSGSERICESETLKLMSNSIYVHLVHLLLAYSTHSCMPMLFVTLSMSLILFFVHVPFLQEFPAVSLIPPVTAMSIRVQARPSWM